MSKFRISLELQGLKLEVEGSREDAPSIARNLTQQLSGLLQPAAQLVAGEIVEVAPSGARAPEGTATSVKTPRRRHAGNAGGGDRGANGAVDWVHDAAAWGSPRQEWNTANKALWLLYVAQKAAGETELSAARIANTFNKHYKQAKTIHASHAARDLGRLKLGKEAAVGENTTVQPPRWFLTDAGRRAVEALIADAKSAAA